jgi:hypothetical protein
MLISQAYKELNQSLHGKGTYGVSGSRWAPHVAEMCKRMGTKDVLDYGCGQRGLQNALGFEIHNYDPCITGLDAAPQPAQIVACTDVLEHIEPECLDAVLDDLKRVVAGVGIFVIAVGPAQKILPDGRNAHLIQEGPRWWLPKLCERFEILQLSTFQGEFFVLVRPIAGPQ